MPVSFERGCALPDAEVTLPVLPSTLKGDLRGKSFFSRSLREDGTLSGLHARLPVADLPSCGFVRHGWQAFLLNWAIC